MTGSEKEWAELRALASDAAPNAPPSPHVTDATLARVRGDDDTPELEPAYRHLAACAACRARLLEPAPLVERVVLEAQRAAQAPPSVVPLRPRRAAILAWAAAAAVVALGTGALLSRSTPEEPIALTQRSYVGMMGEADAEAPRIAPEDRDLELSFAAPASQDAALLITDATGRSLAPPRWFRRAAEGRLTVVLAPRAFAPHEGSAHGFVLAGGGARLREVIGALAESPPSASSLEAYESSLRAIARGVRVQRVTLDR